MDVVQIMIIRLLCVKMYAACIGIYVVIAMPWKDLIMQTPVFALFNLTNFNYFILKLGNMFYTHVKHKVK
jgi:hypothetical protein